MDGIIKETKEITEKLSNIEMEQKQLKEETETENRRLRAEIHTLETRCRKMEDEHRKKNLIVSGIDISPTQNEIENFKSAGLKLGLSQDFLNSVKIDETIRMKKTVSGKPGNVIIKFRYLSDKLSVLKAAKNAKLKDLYIREDFSLETRNIRKNLVNPLMNARKMNLKAFLMSDKLVVEKDGKRNLYTYEPSEEGLKVLKTTFKLELPLLLKFEEDQAEEDDIEENNA